MNNFNLTNYVDQITELAKSESSSALVAVEHFIVNLNTMRDFYKGIKDLNFRELGQQWNSLNYKIRNQQRFNTIKAVEEKLRKSSTRRGGF